MDYGPAPEANGEVKAWLAGHANRFAHFIGGRFVAPREGEYFDVIDPAHEQRLAACAQGSKADVDAAVAAARKAFKSWSALSGAARGRYLYAIARLLQKRARFFAVLETMNNGKPIRESRDIDIPLVIRHFYHHAGWAELARRGIPGHGTARRLRPDHPVEFSVADARLESRAGARRRQHGGAQARRIYALDRPRLRRALPRGRLADGVVNIVTGDGATGALHRRASRISTRSPSPARPKSAA